MRLVPMVIFALLISGCSLINKHESASVPVAPPNSDSAKAELDVPPDGRESLGASVMPSWGYLDLNGPSTWDGICKTGRAQSPIDLKWSKPIRGHQLKFSTVEGEARVIDTGNTIEVYPGIGNHLEIDGKVAELERIEFHSASEHLLSGNSLPLEAHMFYRGKNDEMEAVSIMLIAGDENKQVANIWSNIPHKKGVKSNPFKFSPQGLLPTRLTHYHYVGSLTTPPCTEGVKWSVLNTPVTVSKEQILAFRKLYSVNNRPVQSLNGRKVRNH